MFEPITTTKHIVKTIVIFAKSNKRKSLEHVTCSSLYSLFFYILYKISPPCLKTMQLFSKVGVYECRSCAYMWTFIFVQK